ncbi:DUF3035 domain-containing protein [Algimonas porphyrae]|uniref:DUF3035 domain-containing protein n=1 Tax=Algimonas porphyrae TaxID=1128113 RepID=A0ABQ5V321_9PROT|nr:DUF3035 domain-containing protein [Algimonas porphyrae]GLQ21930.1 hypothetical protein GCM10007854_28850 [Algimonas porphyrae]
MALTSKFALLSAGVAMLALTGCASAGQALGLRKDAPNEFNILTNAPLVVPPEYNLRPPSPGESNLDDNYSQRSAREALIGEIDPTEPTQAEIVFLTRAGAGRADPEVRLKIDGQNSVERKSDGLTSRILFWRDGRQYDADGKPVPLDSEGERRRLESIERVTGGGEVTVTRRPPTAKLPGL